MTEIEWDTHRSDEYVLVPVKELQKLEESRVLLYDFLEKEGTFENTDKVCTILNLTQQVWRVANTRKWVENYGL